MITQSEFDATFEGLGPLDLSSLNPKPKAPAGPFVAAPSYSEDALFLGVDDAGAECGIQTERHAITIGGARGGKGAALIIQNLKRWRQSAVVIDPKGEAAAETAEARRAAGHIVGVLDPFKVADVPDDLRVSINPLEGIDNDALDATADLKVVADGLVKRSNPAHAEWDDGAVSIIAGCAQYVIADAPPERRTLAAVRDLLNQPNESLYADAQLMLDSGALAKTAGVMLMTALESTDKSMERDFLNSARRHTAWIDETPFRSVLGSSDINLSNLKREAMTLFLVLPAQYLDTQGAFLRLFVRTAINAMAKGPKGQSCLFLLDEFFALGKIDIIETAAGLMPGYGVHLWPFLQDLGQLQKLYSQTGAETFFGNADAHVFFHNADMLTLEYISKRMGNLTPEEIAPPYDPEPVPIPRRFKNEHEYAAQRQVIADSFEIPVFKTETVSKPYRHEKITDTGNKELVTPRETLEDVKARISHEDQIAHIRYIHRDQTRRAEYEYAMRRVGTPRLHPQEIAKLTGKGAGDKVARSAIVFGPLGKVHNIKLRPYFED